MTSTVDTWIYNKRKECMIEYLNKKYPGYMGERIEKMATAAVNAGFSVLDLINGLITTEKYGMNRSEVENNQETIQTEFKSIITRDCVESTFSGKAAKVISDMIRYCDWFTHTRQTTPLVTEMRLATRLLDDGLYAEVIDARNGEFRLLSTKEGRCLVPNETVEMIAYNLAWEPVAAGRSREILKWYNYLQRMWPAKMNGYTGNINRLIDDLIDSGSIVVRLPETEELSGVPAQDQYAFLVPYPYPDGGAGLTWIYGGKINPIIQAAFNKHREPEKVKVAVEQPSALADKDWKNSVNVKWTDGSTETFDVDRAEYAGNVLTLTLTSGEVVHISSDKILYWTSPIGGSVDVDIS